MSVHRKIFAGTSFALIAACFFFNPAQADPTPSPPVTPQASDPAPYPNAAMLWSKPLTSGTNGFSRTVEAITGKPVADDMKAFLQGVVSIQRLPDGLKFTREDNETIVLTRDTPFGARVLNAVDEAAEKATRKFGKPAGQMVSKLSGADLEDNHITIRREGAPVVPISIGRQKQEKKLWVKKLKLGDMGFQVSDQSGHSSISNVTGFTVVLSAMDMPLELREFSRSVNEQGLNVYSVGVKNPIPRPISAVLGLNDVVHLRFTEHDQSRRRLDSEDGGLDLTPQKHKKHNKNGNTDSEPIVQVDQSQKHQIEGTSTQIPAGTKADGKAPALSRARTVQQPALRQSNMVLHRLRHPPMQARVLPRHPDRMQKRLRSHDMRER